MPAGIETPILARAHGAQPGFWHRLAAYLTPLLRAQHVPASHTHRLCESPIDRLVRESPSLSVSALAIL